MRNNTPSFILELPLKVNVKEEKELLSRFESARKFYNFCLGEAKKRLNLVRQSKTFQKARKLLSNDDKEKKIRKEMFKFSREKYNYNEYSLHKYVCIERKKIPNQLDIHTTQKIATRAFKATERILYGKAKKVRFKGYNQLNSVESKSNNAGIRWRNNKIIWNKLTLIPIIDMQDEVIQHGLKHKVKYCRILKKVRKGKNYFYVQLILEGKALIKDKNKLGKGIVSFDLGPSTIAIVSKNNDKYNAKLLQFCSELDIKEKQIKKLQRKIDRQRRINNPQNYNEDKTVKKGSKKWNKSNRQKNNENKLREIYRTTTSHRKSLQGKLVNETLRMGNNFKTEKVSKKWLQKLYGKSVNTRSPGAYVTELKRKAESAGASTMEFPTITTKLSQTCVCGRQHKKPLSQREHCCECGVYAQRDLFSAFLGIFVEKKAEDYILQTSQAQKAWQSADKLLQAVWRNVQSTSRGKIPSSFGSFKEYQSQSGSLAEGRTVKSEVQDVVPVSRNGYGESLKEDKMISSRTCGVLTPA